jgi:cytochrome b
VPSNRVYIWNVFIRVLHWLLAGFFVVNYFILDPSSEPHQIIGYLAVSVVFIRLIYGLKTKGFAGFKHVDLSAQSFRAHTQHLLQGNLPINEGHNPFGWLMIFVIFALFTTLATSGFLLEETDRFFGSDLVESIHSLAGDALFVCVCLHILAVFVVGYRGKVALYSSMLTGYRKSNDSKE